MVKKESAIEKPNVEYAKKLGFLALKLTVIGLNGCPDRMYLHLNKTIFFIEYKRPGAKITRKTQHFVKRVLLKFGFDVFVCDNELEGRKLIYHYAKSLEDNNLIKIPEDLKYD